MRSNLLLPLIERGRLIGTLFLMSDRPAAFTQEHIQVAREAADHVAIAVRQAQLFEEVEAARSRLADLSRRLIHTQEDERRHIARELHDEIGQTLTAIKIHLEGIKRAALDVPLIKSRTEECVSLVERTVQQIRGISLDLRPMLLDDFGLVAALRSYIDYQARITGFTSHFHVTPADREFRLRPELETACYRVAQEALTNIARYASAQNVDVSLCLGDSDLKLLVRDDGAGFDVAEARSRNVAESSLGLLGMEERVALVGGRLKIRSEPGAGTEVLAHFPLGTIPLDQ
jgi:signal transduction histidine kinase